MYLINAFCNSIGWASDVIFERLVSRLLALTNKVRHALPAYTVELGDVFRGGLEGGGETRLDDIETLVGDAVGADDKGRDARLDGLAEAIDRGGEPLSMAVRRACICVLAQRRVRRGQDSRHERDGRNT